MSFSPLPPTFKEDLAQLASRGVLELGSGDGRFTALLRDAGVEPWTLDRAGPRLGSRPRIRGDALQPPLSARFGLVVAANLMRHLWPRIREHGPLAWGDLVEPGGKLWVFEDEPTVQPASARHYRELQEFLAAVAPGGRGPLLRLASFRRARERWAWSGRWRDGSAWNRWPVDTARVLELLGNSGDDSGSGRGCLASAIRADGLTYGRYWWANWRRDDSG